eukprot:scaffold44_cov339-Pavlova_lutheri.AAC.11
MPKVRLLPRKVLPRCIPSPRLCRLGGDTHGGKGEGRHRAPGRGGGCGESWGCTCRGFWEARPSAWREADPGRCVRVCVLTWIRGTRNLGRVQSLHRAAKSMRSGNRGHA